MSYTITHNGQLSEKFHAFSGVLMGDPSSPTLWNIFLSTFRLALDPEDMELLTIAISHLEHADDIVLITHSYTYTCRLITMTQNQVTEAGDKLYSLGRRGSPRLSTIVLLACG